MGKRKPLTVKQQAAQLRIIEEKAVNASLRRLRLNLAKLRLKGNLEKVPVSKPRATTEKSKPNVEELRQIEEFVLAGSVEEIMAGSAA